MILGKKIAQGRTAELYAYEPGYVLKLLLPEFPAQEVHWEAQRVQAVTDAGVKTPAVREIVTVDGREGLVMERLDAPTMTTVFRQDPSRLPQLAQAMARVHADLHTHSGASLPSYKDWLAYNINRARPLNDIQRTALLARLDALPDGDTICHGDVHPDNILMPDENGVLIDWVNANAGHPCADVARTVLIMRAVSDDDPDSPVFTFLQIYLDTYFEITGRDRAVMEAWLPVMAGSRLTEGVTGHETAFLLRLVDA